MVKKIILLVFLVLCILIAGFKIITRDRQYEDVPIDTNIYTISDCVECAKEILGLQDRDVHLSDINFSCNDIDVAEVNDIDISFVEINNHIPFKPYIWYTITIDIKNNVACNIEKRYGEHIIYDDLDFNQWKLNLNNVFTNEKIVSKLSEYELMEGSGISVVTSNKAWYYLVTTADYQNLRISIDPK